MTLPVAPALFGLGLEQQPDFMETYEQVVDDQLAEEATEAEDQGTAPYLADFID